MTDTNTNNVRIIVRCEDGIVRHLHEGVGSFATQAEAATWAEWGHCCTNRHTFEAITPLGSQGCVVLPNLDGPSLWDCECAECTSMQREAE